MATKCVIFFVAAIFFAILVVNGDQETGGWNPNDDEFTQSSINYDSFDWLLTKSVSMHKKSFLLSPLGLKIALSVVDEASTGVTQKELLTVLGFDADRSRLRRKYHTIVDSLKKKSPHNILNLGNRIYVNNLQPRQRFKAIADMFYMTDIDSLDFSEPAVATQQINKWASNYTQGKIPEIINEDDIRNSVMLIVSTVYFKGSWHHQFPPEATKSGIFYASEDKWKIVPFMNVVDNFYYTVSAKFGAQVLRMPYRGNKYAMYIIMPVTLNGLPQVFDNLGELRSELFKLEENLVNVTIPKLNYDNTLDLKRDLRKLGVLTAFEDGASIPGIARAVTSRLKMSKVIQRSRIEVDELGNVPYSAADTPAVNSFGEGTPIFDILVNRPFLFFIQDESTRQLLFTGKVTDLTFIDGAFKT